MRCGLILDDTGRREDTRYFDALKKSGVTHSHLAYAKAGALDLRSLDVLATGWSGLQNVFRPRISREEGKEAGTTVCAMPESQMRYYGT